MKSQKPFALIWTVGGLFSAVLWSVTLAPENALAKGKPGGNEEPTLPAPITDDTKLTYCVNFENTAVEDLHDPTVSLVPRITSDGWFSQNLVNQYCHGEDDFWARSHSSRIRQATLGTTANSKDLDRMVSLDFDFDDTNNHVPEFDRPIFLERVDVEMRFRLRTPDFDYMGQMLPGTSVPTLNFRVNLGEDLEGNLTTLIFAPDASPAEGCGGENGIVTRIGPYTWTIEAKRACLVKWISSQENVRYLVDVPFKMIWMDDRYVRYLEQLP
jgi:hypothetical protein